jgi:hypothetical protein
MGTNNSDSNQVRICLTKKIFSLSEYFLGWKIMA